MTSPPKTTTSFYEGFRSFSPKNSIFFALVGTEELAHLEMIAAILYQLTRNLTPEEIKKTGFDTYFVDHTAGIYPQSASGTPFTAAYIGIKGDVFADLNEDLAADAAYL